MRRRRKGFSWAVGNTVHNKLQWNAKIRPANMEPKSSRSMISVCIVGISSNQEYILASKPGCPRNTTWSVTYLHPAVGFPRCLHYRHCYRTAHRSNPLKLHSLRTDHKDKLCKPCKPKQTTLLWVLRVRWCQFYCSAVVLDPKLRSSGMLLYYMFSEMFREYSM